MTWVIDILNKKAIALLRELEALDLIRVVDDAGAVPADSPGTKRPSDYKGKVPSAVAEELQEYVRKSRGEWRDRI